MIIFWHEYGEQYRMQTDEPDMKRKCRRKAGFNLAGTKKADGIEIFTFQAVNLPSAKRTFERITGHRPKWNAEREHYERGAEIKDLFELNKRETRYKPRLVL